MRVNSQLILEYRSSGCNNGQVFIHMQREAVQIYYGPAAQRLYESLKRFVQNRRVGSGEFYEHATSGGKQWRERL